MELDVENDFGTGDREKEAENFDAINEDGELPNSNRETDTGRNFIESDGVKARTNQNGERSAGIRNFKQVVKENIDFLEDS